MTKFATSNDGNPVAFEVHGEGEPSVVLVHGWSCDRSYWDLQLRPLSVAQAVVAIDLVGHGESGSHRCDWTIAAFAGDVAAVVLQLGLHDVILVGHSMGADVVLEAARLLPGLVLGLVWIDQYTRLTGFMSESAVDDRVAPFRADFEGTTRAFVRRLFSDQASSALVDRVSKQMACAQPRIAIPSLAATWHHAQSVPGILAELGLPVVAINAVDPMADHDSLTRAGVRVHTMPRVGHFPMLEEPVEFNALLARVIEQFRSLRSDA